MSREASSEQRPAVIWHDVECGAYGADLPLWEKLAATADGPILELGCGTGRAALHLARRSHRVTGLDSDRALVEALNARAAGEGLAAHAVVGDARDFSLPGHFGLVLAPMQLIQLLPGATARGSCLRAIAAHLRPGGSAALAIVEGGATGSSPSPPLPDVRQERGWVYSSLPLGVAAENGGLRVERLRQIVSPSGRLREERHGVRLEIFTADALEREADAAGLRPMARHRIEATGWHVGSTVVVLEA
jgi:SAM-dependent methyltransferase